MLVLSTFKFYVQFFKVGSFYIKFFYFQWLFMVGSFLRSVFLRLVFQRSVFLRLVVLRSVFLRSVFLRQRWIFITYPQVHGSVSSYAYNYVSRNDISKWQQIQLQWLVPMTRLHTVDATHTDIFKDPFRKMLIKGYMYLAYYCLLLITGDISHTLV